MSAPKDPGAILGPIFWQAPATARAVMTTGDLRAVLLHFEGRIVAKGRVWDITSRHLGAGVHEVTLRLPIR